MQSHSIVYLAIFLAIQVVALAAPNNTLLEARREYDRLLERTTRDTDRATKTLENEAEVIRQLSSGVTSVGSNLIRRESRRFQQELEKIANETAAEHVNVTVCLKSKGGAIKELTDLSELELAVCVNRYSSQGQLSVSQGFGNMNTIVTEVFALQRRLENCKADDQNCIGYIISEVSFQLNDVPRRIQEQLDLSGNKVEANRLYLSDCGIRVSENLAKYGSGIISEVEKCVDNIINPKPKPF